MIENQYFWNNICLLAIGTFAIRGSIIALSSKIQISARTKELFSYIPAAILPAFAVPAAFFHTGRIDPLLGKERFAVLVLATVICYFTRSTLATIGLGLIALFILTSIF